MPYIWRATVIIGDKDMKDVTVQADDAWRAQHMIERQYGHLIAGPSRVFTAPNMDGEASGGCLATDTSRTRFPAAEFLMVAVWIAAALFFRSSGLSWLWALGAATGILLLSIGLLKATLDELRKRAKRLIREDP
jgi:hypothetical protein